jgi:sucrose-6-phosphate hydrolase SacC (GH32 family)
MAAMSTFTFAVAAMGVVVSIHSRQQPPCTKQPCCVDGTSSDTNWTACRPGFQYCHPLEEGWEKTGPQYHLRDRTGCGENDPNGIVFDPVHGVVHHFFQKHLAAPPGGGPVYGHFASKDMIKWAALPVAIWNGMDYSSPSARVTPWDNQAIYTGSAFVVDGAGPGGKGPGVVNLFPGLCTPAYWSNCSTGVVLAQAVPAHYATDVLLENWTKPAYNPVVENAHRDPASPWKTASGEWRTRTFDSTILGSASDATVVAGEWYTIGKSTSLRQCECPSLYQLPPPTPGFEAEFEAAAGRAGGLPTHVHKTSCGPQSDGAGYFDWWQAGTYVDGARGTLPSFNATSGWEDLFVQRVIDTGFFYSSKDNLFPTKGGASATRRINWGWAILSAHQGGPGGPQSLPRTITFNPLARVLEQAPTEELEALRGEAVLSKTGLKVAAGAPMALGVAPGMAKRSEIVVNFVLPGTAATFGIALGARDAMAGPPGAPGVSNPYCGLF